MSAQYEPDRNRERGFRVHGAGRARGSSSRICRLRSIAEGRTCPILIRYTQARGDGDVEERQCLVKVAIYGGSARDGGVLVEVQVPKLKELERRCEENELCVAMDAYAKGRRTSGRQSPAFSDLHHRLCGSDL